MIDCDAGHTACSVYLAFGIFSILCLILVVLYIKGIEIVVFSRNPQLQVLFMAYFLCIMMALYYFLIGFMGPLLYFIKEFLLLLASSYTSYFFIFQAYGLLSNNKLVTYSLRCTIAAVAAILLIILLYPLIIFLLERNSDLECGKIIWMVMRGLGVFLSLVFVFLGVLINKKQEVMMMELNVQETKVRKLYLW